MLICIPKSLQDIKGEVIILHFREYGDKDGSLMVFLHGGGVSSWMWDKQISYFRDNYHCITIDLPEHGQSKDSAVFSIANTTEAVIKIIERVSEGKKVVLIGFSIGAQISIQILSMRPNLIDVAMINSALVRPSPYLQKWIIPSVKLTFPLVKNKLFSTMQAKTLYISKEQFDTYYEESRQMDLDTLIRVLQENMKFTIPETFKNVKAKILVTVGEKEKSIMKKSAIDIVANNPNYKVIIVSNIGHGFPLAKPDLFNQTLEKWIEEDSF